eukprot:gene5466-3896_t
MASPVPAYVHDEVFRTMNAAFQELPFYEKVIQPKMMKLISDADRVVMDHKVHKRLTERYYDVAEFNKTEQGKLMLTQIHIAVRACYVLIMTYHESKQDLMWRDVQQLLAAYPELHGQDDEELRYLLQFRNMLRLALEIVPPRLNKKLLINIAARLEGSGREYITGGGQKPCVTRRVLIYEREGNVQAEKRDERPRRPVASASGESGDDVSESTTLTGKKRTQLNPSMKKLKMIRLDSHEAKQYIRTTVPLPSNALLTLSRECSKHLMQTDGDEAVASASSGAPVDDASTALDDLLLFHPAPAPSPVATAAASSSFLVPPFQASSGTFAIPLSVSRSSSAASLAAPSQAPSSSTKAQASLRRDLSDFSFHFPPGLLSRQQSELLSSLASSCHGAAHAEMAWLSAWDAVVAEQQSHDSASAGQAHHHSHSHSHSQHDAALPASATSVVLPMLRAVSWDAIENGSFAEDLVRVLATF